MAPREKEECEGFLRPRLELAHCYSCRITLAKACPKASLAEFRSGVLGSRGPVVSHCEGHGCRDGWPLGHMSGQSTISGMKLFHIKGLDTLSRKLGSKSS